MKQGSEFDSPLQTAHLCACYEKIHAQLGCVARVWPGAFSVLLVPRCCQVLQLSTYGKSGLLTKIVHADIALGASKHLRKHLST